MLSERVPRKYRNPFLVTAMTELNLIDHLGNGIHRIVADQRRRFLPMPDYDLSDPSEVKLTIHGAVIDEAYTRLMMVRTDLSLEDVLALDRVQKKVPISKRPSPGSGVPTSSRDEARTCISRQLWQRRPTRWPRTYGPAPSRTSSTPNW